MKDDNENKAEEPNPENYRRFIRLITQIAAVPKAAIYERDPALRPKPVPYRREGVNL